MNPFPRPSRHSPPAASASAPSPGRRSPRPTASGAACTVAPPREPPSVLPPPPPGTPLRSTTAPRATPPPPSSTPSANWAPPRPSSSSASTPGAAPDLLARMHEEGHLVANHSLDHDHLGMFRGRRYWDAELGMTDEIIRQATGVRPAMFRPPMGVKTGFNMAAARRRGHAVVAWSRRGMDGIRTTPGADPRPPGRADGRRRSDRAARRHRAPPPAATQPPRWRRSSRWSCGCATGAWSRFAWTNCCACRRISRRRRQRRCHRHPPQHQPHEHERHAPPAGRRTRCRRASIPAGPTAAGRRSPWSGG